MRALAHPQWTFLPYQPRAELGTVLSQADVHLVLLDPRVERTVFPSKLYGSLAAGRPVLHLGDPAGDVAALLRQERCGWTLRPGSGPEILALLETLKADPAQVAEAGRRARRAYEHRFARSTALAAWVEALRTSGRQTV